jgi:hypothetical protein
MGSISDKLVYLGETKSQIRDAIQSKGVTVPVNTTFRDYATKIGEITAGTGFTGEWTQEWYESVYNSTMGAYVRPADWLPIDHLVNVGDQKIVMLVAVFDHNSNFHAFRVTTSSGNYRVDWGDGTVTDYASGTNAERNFNYANFSGTESARGYRQAIVTITAVSGNLTVFDANYKHSQTGLQNGYSEGYLDIRMSGSEFTTLRFSGGSAISRSMLLERFNYIGTNKLTTLTNVFASCYSLRYLNAFDTSNVTAMTSAFASCFSLQTIPMLNTSKVVSFLSFFQSSSSLVTIPMLDTSNVTVMQSTFSGCNALLTVPLLNTSKCTNMLSMFSTCGSLMRIPLLNTSLVNTMNGMFNSAPSLIEAPLLDTSLVTNVTNMFNSCTALNIVPALNLNATTSSTDFTSFLSANPSLSKISVSGIKNSFSVNACKLSASALVEIFNNLEVVSGKSITITSNWGASLLTTQEREIATNKGWTIIG